MRSRPAITRSLPATSSISNWWIDQALKLGSASESTIKLTMLEGRAAAASNLVRLIHIRLDRRNQTTNELNLSHKGQMGSSTPMKSNRSPWRGQRPDAIPLSLVQTERRSIGATVYSTVRWLGSLRLKIGLLNPQGEKPQGLRPRKSCWQGSHLAWSRQHFSPTCWRYPLLRTTAHTRTLLPIYAKLESGFHGLRKK